MKSFEEIIDHCAKTIFALSHDVKNTKEIATQRAAIAEAGMMVVLVRVFEDRDRVAIQDAIHKRFLEIRDEMYELVKPQ